MAVAEQTSQLRVSEPTPSTTQEETANITKLPTGAKSKTQTRVTPRRTRTLRAVRRSRRESTDSSSEDSSDTDT